MAGRQSFESCLTVIIPNSIFKVVKRGVGNDITRVYLKNCRAFQRLGMPCTKEQHSPAVYSGPKTFVASGHPADAGVSRV